MSRSSRLLVPAALTFLGVLALLPDRGRSAPAPISTAHKQFTNSIGMKLVRIPAGKFVMGSPPDERGRSDVEQQHEVEISRPFYLGVYHVTQGQYEKVMGINPSHFAASRGEAGGAAGLDTQNFPVDTLTWNDAVDFCKKLSDMPGERNARRVYRLPTEAEWEYACRAGTTTAYHFGDTITPLHANFSESPARRTTKVGSYKPNAWGLFDMHGNVWHMCADYYEANYYRVSPRRDPTGPPAGTNWVARGGSWSNGPTDCRSAFRAWVTPGQRNNLVGFRVACDVGRR